MPSECRQMVEAARSAGLLLGVAQVFRFEESTARLRERVAAGEIGKIVFARSEFSFPGGPDTLAPGSMILRWRAADLSPMWAFTAWMPCATSCRMKLSG